MAESLEVPAGRFDIRRLGAGAELEAWDAFVSRSPQCHPFATRAWLEASTAAAGATLDFWVATKGQEWVAAVPVAWRMRLGRPFYFGLPLAAYATFLYRPSSGGHPASATHEHLEVTQALAEAVARRTAMTSLLLSPAIDDVRPWTWAKWRATPRYTYVMDLAAEPRLADSVRRHVRKCAESGFTISETWDFARFREVFDETRERQGFGVSMSPETFARLAQTLYEAKLAWMLTALDGDGKAAASQIVLSVPGTPGAYMWVAGTRAAHLRTGASAWLMVEIAAAAKRRGHAFYDLCGADYPSIARFKAELGGRLVHYFQVDAPRTWVERRLRDLRDRMSRGGPSA